LAPFLGRVAVCSIRCGLLLLMWRGLLVTSECCAKTAELIDMPFGCGFGRARGNVADRRGQFFGIILGHAQACPRSIFSTLLSRDSSDAASGYQSAVSPCFHLESQSSDSLSLCHHICIVLHCVWTVSEAISVLYFRYVNGDS